MNLKLHEDTLALVREERRVIALVIENLQKISNSRLFLDMGYSSLFEYCHKALGYSEACAYRRIQAMKAARILPEVKEKLNSGVLNLTNLAMAQSLISSANLSLEEKREVVARIENVSKREAEKAIAEFSIRNGIVLPPKREEKVCYVSATEADLNIRLPEATLTKVNRLKHLRAHKKPKMSYAELIDDMCEFMLKKIDPGAKEPIQKQTTPAKTTLAQKPATPSKNPRYVPQRLKTEIWRRDHGRCTFVDERTTRRCESRQLLQLDHVHPLFLGGQTTAQNLRLLCHAHHKDQEREF